MKKLHNLKILPAYFADVWHGRKTFEVRKDDRGFAIGDALILNEYDPSKPEGQQYTGRFIRAEVPYILRDPQYVKEGHCVLSLFIARRWGDPV